MVQRTMALSCFFAIARVERCSWNHSAQEDQAMYFCPLLFTLFQHITIYDIAGAMFTTRSFNVYLIYFSTLANIIFVILCSVLTWFIWCVSITRIVHVGLHRKKESSLFSFSFRCACFSKCRITYDVAFSRFFCEMQLGCCISSLFFITIGSD